MTGYRVGLFDSLKEFGDQRAEENLERLMEEAEKRSESPEPSDYAGTWIPRHLERGDQVTALWVAVQNDPEWVRRLVDDEDIDPNLRLTLEGSDSWSTPLGESAKHGFAESVDVLLEAGAELDAADSNGWTALHTAAFFGHPTVVDRLLAAGADPVTKTGGGLTAIELAREKGNDTAVGLLEEHQREH